LSGYKRKAISGFLWQAFGLVGQQGIQLVANMLFARLLLKSENGVIVAAVVILDYATLLRVSGISQAFVAYEGDDTETRHTVFWACLASGVAMSLAIFFGAPLVASLLNSPGLSFVLRALAVTQLIDSLKIVPFSLIWRHLRFRERTIAETTPYILGLGAAVVGLFVLPAERRIEAVVWMYIVRSVGQAILFLYYERYWPKRIFDWTFFRLISRRAATVLAFNLPSSTLVPLPSIAVFGRAGEVAGGAFGLAAKVVSPASRLSYAANITLFPIFARLRDDREKLIPAILRSLKTVGAAPVAILALIVATAPQLIPLILGERWRSAVPVAQLLACAGVFEMYSYVMASVLLAANKAAFIIVTWSTTLALAAALLFFWPMARGDAATGAALAVGYGAVGFLISLASMSIAFRIPFLRVCGSLLPAFLSAGAALAAADLAGMAVGAPLVSLAVKVFVFLAVFIPLCGILLGGTWRSLLSAHEIKELIRAN
jgi:lipopolysaccharide exporter